MRTHISHRFINSLNLGSKILSNPSPKNGTCASSRPMSSCEGRLRRNMLFTQEQKRQREKIGRIDKIQVEYSGVPEDVTLVMNGNISTPYNCAQHMSEMLLSRSALALVDGTSLWDMHRPLESDCRLQLLHFKEADPYSVNKAFWRTCSLILGAVVERCFKQDVGVTLHSFPSPNVRSGSFVYDVDLTLENWQPKQDELRIISAEMVKLCRENTKLERLIVSAQLAQDMFQDNVYKTEQIPNIVSQSPEEKITLYRLGDHIDISRGPMVADTSFVGRCTVASVHRVTTDNHNLYRFQGVALPKGFVLNHVAYGILENQARKLNPARYSDGGPDVPSRLVADAVSV